MNTEIKLDQIIELLTGIDAKLSRRTAPDEHQMEVVSPAKPIKSMLKSQRRIDSSVAWNTRTFSQPPEASDRSRQDRTFWF
jgi:hypothetical protein